VQIKRHDRLDVQPPAEKAQEPPPPQEPPPQEEPQQPEAEQQAPPEPEPQQQQEQQKGDGVADLGASSGLRQRDVMDLIKRPAPLLSMEAYEEDERPLGGLVDAAGRNEKTVWNRVSIRF